MEAAFFDLDKTVIARSSVLAFGKPLYRAGLIPRRALLRSLFGQVVYRLGGASEARMDKARDAMLSVTRGWEQAVIKRVIGEGFEKVVRPLIYAEAIELFAQHKAAGRKVFLVSASPTEIVSLMAVELGADGCIASVGQVDDAGRLTGALDFYAYGPHKAAAIRTTAEAQGIDLSRSFAYSDSATDAPMLEVVGHPVAVNPDRELARLAARKGWEVRRFENPVQLRRRVGAPSPGQAAALAGGAAALGLTWAACRRLRRAV